jgi:CRISPR/Cas system CSM-associated protein Csm3 (group 7 of RAMP superfamily)
MSVKNSTPTGKIVIEGEIELLCPAIIGSGKDENSDVDLLKDSQGNAYIPATSFAGVLRHSIKLGSNKNQIEYFWGSQREESNHEKIRQSSIIIDDLLPVNEPNIEIRDGVKIDNKRGIAKDKGKFDYEIIGSGSKFKLRMEVTLNNQYDEFKKDMLKKIIAFLQNEKIRIGAKTNSGFGRIKLSSHKIYTFDFSKKEDVLRWLKQDFSVISELNVEDFEPTEKTFTINADFIIKNSLIVRSYNYDPDKPDIEHIKSNKKPVLPGTSIKGAIRARAERIIKTLGKPDSIITDLFGDVDEKRKKAKKGKITVEEAIIEGYPEEVQTRIKIDRFTGGVIESALLETKPIFSKENPSNFDIKITINNYEDHEAGLMLLVLKDLWTGDLPIGGEKAIGRGVLQGKCAKISWNGDNSNKISFSNIEELQEHQKKMLNNFVLSLVNYGGKS